MKSHPINKLATTAFSILMLLLGILSCVVNVNLFLNARLLHLPNFLFVIIIVVVFIFAIIIIPVLLMINTLSKSERQKSQFYILICAEITFTAVLCLQSFWTASTNNKTLYASPLTFELITQKIKNNTVGMYFFSTWKETGTFAPEETFFANWIDFPKQYDVNDNLYYFHANKETTESIDFMQKQKNWLGSYGIDTLPAVIINSKQKVFCFENITYNSIRAANDECTLKFKQYLSQNYNAKQTLKVS